MAAFTESDWTSYWPVTIDHNQVAATMPDGGESLFPVDLVIDEANNINWQADLANLFDNYVDAGDLCFTAEPYGANTLAHGIKRIVTTPGSRYLAAGIGISSIAGAVDTAIRMYGISALGDQQNKAGVYPVADGWVNYWPLEEDAAGTGIADLYKDWTSNANDGDDYVSSTDKVGWIGQGQDFVPGTTDYILLGNPASLQITSALTIMAQIKVDAYTTSPIIMAKHMGSPNRGYYLQGRATGVLDFGVSSTGADLNTISSTTSIGTGWRHVAGRFAPSTRQSVFVDGVEESPQTVGVYASIYNTPANARIGAHDVPGGHMDGHIDELSVSAAYRSDNWILTTCNCQKYNDAFWTVGAEVPVGGAAVYEPRRFNRRMIMPGMSPGFMVF